MKVMLTMIGVMLIIIGAIWFLQGINIVGGSFMTDQREWAVYGAITILVGGGVLFFTHRRKIPKP